MGHLGQLVPLGPQDLRPYSSYIAAALGSVMLHELASVVLTHRTAR